MVRISVKNFGPIVEGSVDLKPLTIFIGPSNTGKSFMAGAIYAVMRASNEIAVNFYLPVATRYHSRDVFFPVRPSRLAANVDDELIEEINDWVFRTDPGDGNAVCVEFSDLPCQVHNAVNSYLMESVRLSTQFLEHEFRLVYGSIPHILKRNHAGGQETLALRIPGLTLNLNFKPDGVESDSDIDVPQGSEATIPSRILHQIQSQPQDNDQTHSDFIRLFAGAYLSGLDENLFNADREAYYLPAARSGMTQAHKVVAASIIRQSSFIGLESVNIPTLPGVTTEFLSKLITLHPSTATLLDDDALAKAIDFIEREVLHGSIDLDQSGGLPFPDIAYEQAGAGKFTLDQTSSMVSELAPLVLFLRYLVRPGDLLILEEPESHLHPAAQRQMARGIVRLVNAGVKVLITTHSDLFVAQVNNLMRVSHASKRWLREKGFAPEECIDRENVGAYLFRRNEEQGGSLVEELEIRPDVGIDEGEFLNVVESLYEESLLVQRIRVNK